MYFHLSLLIVSILLVLTLIPLTKSRALSSWLFWTLDLLVAVNLGLVVYGLENYW